ncbi:TPA: hypothetical protein N0F65_007407 [Lagenidium giganteum]|uniref:WD repeat-containing protein 89 n=1 Tax=Lagenidium giganteum TaxID=4803 RepID=A0AAV2ZI89_9STRA|nr:TPA: hypothetical protein N0F65_007407 [Lagenidium giganteum]
MRDAVTKGLGLAQSAVVTFGQQQNDLVTSTDDYDYDYVLDCKPTAQGGPLALALSNMKVQLRDRETLALQQEFHAHNSTIHEIWASDASPWSIATCSSDEHVKLWDLRSKLPAMVVPIGCEAWSLSIGLGDSLLAVGTDVKAHFFDVRSGKKLGEYGESHIDAVTKVRFHPTQLPFIVTASEDGVVCLFNCSIPDEDEAIESILNVESAVTNIGFFGQNLENIYCLTGTETLDLWNLQSAQRIHHYETIRPDCNANGISTDYLIDCVYDRQTDDLFLLTGDHSGTLNSINIGSNGQHGQLQLAATLKGGHKACIRSAYYDPARLSLYTGGEDARLCRWTAGAPVSAAASPSPAAMQWKNDAAHDPAGIKKARKSSRPY